MKTSTQCMLRPPRHFHLSKYNTAQRFNALPQRLHLKATKPNSTHNQHPSLLVELFTLPSILEFTRPTSLATTTGSTRPLYQSSLYGKQFYTSQYGTSCNSQHDKARPLRRRTVLQSICLAGRRRRPRRNANARILAVSSTLSACITAH